MFCKNCGNQVTEDSIYCSKCGQKTEIDTSPACQPSVEARVPKDNIPVHQKYKGKITTVNIVSCVKQVLALLLVAVLFFAPIFTFSYEPQSIEEWEEVMGREFELSDLGDLFESGSEVINDKFSIYDDVKMSIGSIIRIFKGEDVGVPEMMSIPALIFPIFTLLLAVILITTVSSRICSSLYRFSNMDKLVLTQYSEIKKSGNISSQKLEGFFQKQSVMSLIMFVFTDLFVSKLLHILVLKEFSDEINFGFIRYMLYFSGFSAGIGIVGFGLILYVVINSIEKRLNSELVYEINQENI